MFSLTKRLHPSPSRLRAAADQLRYARTDAAPSRRRGARYLPSLLKKPEEKSEWWIVDGEMHEIGDHVPPRERFAIPRDNFPNKRRKQLREQFMRRTRLVIKEKEHEHFGRKYMELYQELRENWERLYWDEGYSKKIAIEHANYESAEDDDEDFSPYRNNRRTPSEQMKGQGFVRTVQGDGDNWEKVNQVRDKFEYDRERRMHQKAFAPMNRGTTPQIQEPVSPNRPFDAQRYFARSEDDSDSD